MENLELEIKKVLRFVKEAESRRIRKELGYPDDVLICEIGKICDYSDDIVSVDKNKHGNNIWCLKKNTEEEMFDPAKTKDTLETIMNSLSDDRDSHHLKRALQIVDKYEGLEDLELPNRKKSRSR